MADNCPRRVLASGPKPEEAPYESPGVYIQGQRIIVEKVRNVFVWEKRSRFDETRRTRSSGVIF